MAQTAPASTRPSGPRRDDIAREYAQQVADIMNAAETLILAAIASAVRRVLSGTPVTLESRRLRDEVVTVMARARAAVAALLTALARDTRADVQQIITDELGGRPLPARPLPSLARLAGDLRKAELAAAAAAMAVFAAILATARKHGTPAGRTAEAQRLLDDLAYSGLHAFTDSSGGRWGLATYASAATAGAAGRAHLALQAAAYGDEGTDLVLITRDSSKPPCPRCEPYVWKVLSLSGHHTGPATITDAAGDEHTVHVSGTLADAVAHGLFHPRCRDSASPWADGAAITPDAAPSAAAAAAYKQRYDAEQRASRRQHALLTARRRQAMALTPQARTKAARMTSALRDA